jgi:NAD(P)-dependent dehydrogenase (short-subunit alcohol dehydrogenase family)
MARPRNGLKSACASAFDAVRSAIGCGRESSVLDFQGRHVVVTGGTGALGVAVVGALLEAGAVCHVPYVVEQEAQQFPHRDHPKVRLARDADLTKEDVIDKLYDGIPTLWASIHLAGGFAMAPLADTKRSDLMHQIELNLVTCFLCCRAAVRAMTRGNAGGRIVNVAARPALEWRTGAGMTAYTATKAAVAALTVALAQEVANDRILVNAVAPSIIDTPANRRSMPNADHSAWPKPAQIAQTIAFLASPDNQVTRGGIVPVYGRV